MHSFTALLFKEMQCFPITGSLNGIPNMLRSNVRVPLIFEGGVANQPVIYSRWRLLEQFLLVNFYLIRQLRAFHLNYELKMITLLFLYFRFWVFLDGCNENSSVPENIGGLSLNMYIRTFFLLSSRIQRNYNSCMLPLSSQKGCVNGA